MHLKMHQKRSATGLCPDWEAERGDLDWKMERWGGDTECGGKRGQGKGKNGRGKEGRTSIHPCIN